MKCSVVITSFNKAWSLDRCFRGVDMQQTTFDFEIIIADDGSKDNSVSISQNYDFKHKVRIISGSHVGIMRNFARAIDACSWEYIAFCDGDDYWIDELKLQKQVDYMDAHPECGICHAGVITHKECNPLDFPDMINPDFDKMLKGGYVYALTVMIRASLYPRANMHKYIKLGFNAWDFPMFMQYIHMSNIHLISDRTAVYCVYDESYSHSHSRVKRIKVIGGMMWVKFYFILKYGCKFSTVLYLLYRVMRDTYSIIFKRWYK